jgi:hypothetical protein
MRISNTKLDSDFAPETCNTAVWVDVDVLTVTMVVNAVIVVEG